MSASPQSKEIQALHQRRNTTNNTVPRNYKGRCTPTTHAQNQTPHTHKTPSHKRRAALLPDSIASPYRATPIRTAVGHRHPPLASAEPTARTAPSKPTPDKPQHNAQRTTRTAQRSNTNTNAPSSPTLHLRWRQAAAPPPACGRSRLPSKAASHRSAAHAEKRTTPRPEMSASPRKGETPAPH